MTLSIVTVVAFVAAGLLVAAGVTKILRPLSTARAMYAAGLPGRVTLVRGIGIAEVGVGIWFLLAPLLAASFGTVVYSYVVYRGLLRSSPMTKPRKR